MQNEYFTGIIDEKGNISKRDLNGQQIYVGIINDVYKNLEARFKDLELSFDELEKLADGMNNELIKAGIRQRKISQEERDELMMKELKASRELNERLMKMLNEKSIQGNNTEEMI